MIDDGSECATRGIVENSSRCHLTHLMWLRPSPIFISFYWIRCEARTLSVDAN